MVGFVADPAIITACLDYQVAVQSPAPGEPVDKRGQRIGGGQGEGPGQEPRGVGGKGGEGEANLRRRGKKPLTGERRQIDPLPAAVMNPSVSWKPFKKMPGRGTLMSSKGGCFSGGGGK